jgi:protein-disulfide isomerase
MHRYFLACLLLFTSVGVLAQRPDDVIATATGRTFRLRDLAPEVQRAVADLPANIAKARADLFDHFINDRLLELEAKTSSISSGKLLWNEKAKAPKPTEATIKAFYEANKGRLGGASLAEVRENIADHLRADAEQKALSALIARLRAKYRFSAGKNVNAPGLAATDVVATIGGKALTAREFDQFASGELREGKADLDDLIIEGLTETIVNALIADEAKKENIDAGSFIAREITNKMREFSDEERVSLQDGLAKRLFAKYQVKILHKVPEPPVENVSADDDPAIGPASAPVTIIMFSDFQCSACAATHPMLKQVIAEFEGKVKLVVRDFPLEAIHGNGFDAARAAGAAHAQGKFFEYIEILYKKQDALDAASLKKYAAEIGLNAGQFAIDFNSETAAAEVRKDMADGEALGIHGTPTIFINGRRVRNISPESIRAMIQSALPK